MPEISRFYGIIIKMFFDDHNPPHFHTFYGGDEAGVSISVLAVIAGAPKHTTPAQDRRICLMHVPAYRADTPCTRRTGAWRSGSVRAASVAHRSIDYEQAFVPRQPHRLSHRHACHLRGREAGADGGRRTGEEW